MNTATYEYTETLILVNTGTCLEDPPVDQVCRQQDRTQEVSLQADRPRCQVYFQTVRESALKAHQGYYTVRDGDGQI